MLDLLVIIFAVLLVIAGFVGILIPVVPDLPLLWLGALILAWATDFELLTWGGLLILLALVIGSAGIDAFGQIYGAKRFGASRYGIVGSILGLLVGFFFSIPGMLLGPFVGAFVFELFAGRSRHQALKASLGTFVGFIGGVAFKFVLAFMMVGIMVVEMF